MSTNSIKNELQLEIMSEMLNLLSSDNSISGDGSDSSSNFDEVLENALGSGNLSSEATRNVDLTKLPVLKSKDDISTDLKYDVSVGNLSIEQAVDNASKKYGVDKNLILAVIKQESGFNPNATSGAGAEGLMQLMPSTASELGVTNAYDVSQNVDGGTKYLKSLLDTFGNYKMAIAAYNAGPGAVESSGEDLSKLPSETKNYVSKVSAYYADNSSKLV